jgi:hypothetical protein
MSNERLKQLFGAMNEDLPAVEFKEQLLKRIKRADRVRYAVLAVAAAVGFIITAGPLWDLLLLGARELLAAMVTMREADVSVDERLVLVVLLLGVLPGLVRWLER